MGSSSWRLARFNAGLVTRPFERTLKDLGVELPDSESDSELLSLEEPEEEEEESSRAA